ncbi:hypothetical protein [Rossellomorea marisflavi]|uniref:hypothetical protein n=1 Tax=Rossellomorea marisflavi TaxID=189381 RepID=UPI00345D6030
MILGGNKNCGKTTKLIEIAAKENLYIVCPSRQRADFVYRRSLDLNKSIPYPVSMRDLPLRGHMKEVLVDDVEDLLPQLIGKPIRAMSSSEKFELL